MLTTNERHELELLRKLAYQWMDDPLDQICFELKSILDRPESTRLDSVMPSNIARKLIQAILLIKERSNQCACGTKS